MQSIPGEGREAESPKTEGLLWHAKHGAGYLQKHQVSKASDRGLRLIHRGVLVGVFGNEELVNFTQEIWLSQK